MNRNRNTHRGYTLLELAISLIVMGLVVVLIWRFSSATTQRIEEVKTPQTLLAADQALIGFAAANSRLPCPATSNNGIESPPPCAVGVAATGFLPWATLGLARADVKDIRYGVYRNAALASDLAVASDTFYPWLALVPSAAGIAPSAIRLPVGAPAKNGMDFCSSLYRLFDPGTAPAVDANKLNVRAPNPVAPTVANSTVIKNVAYALSLPGRRSDPASNLNTIANSFASPAQPVSADYDDTVLAVDFGQLFDRLSCGGVLSAAGHAHPNAATSAAILYGAFLDYKVQLDLAKEMAHTTELSAGAGVASAVAGAATAAANVLVASAWAVITLGSASGMIGFAAAAVVTNASAIATNAVTTAMAVAASDIITARIEEFSGTTPSSLHLLQDAKALATGSPPIAGSLIPLEQAPSIRRNAIAADAAGLY